MNRFVSKPPIGIRFGRYLFSEPVPLGGFWIPPRTMGLYVILVPDPTWMPRPFQPIFFGEFGPDRPSPVTYREYITWFRAAAGRHLHIAVLEVQSGELGHVPVVKRELVRTYDPICDYHAQNEFAGDDLSRKLDVLEKKDYEHEALLRVMLAAVGRLLEPPAEPPRKRQIGFLPDPPSGPNTVRSHF